MKIFKYLILLFLLVCGTLSVFVATKDGSFFIEKSKIIDVTPDIVYKYVADKNNWDSINSWRNDNLKIISVEKNENESIIFTVVLNENENQLKFEIKDTLNKKSIATWSTQGKQTFKDKLLSMIGRGTKNDFGDHFEESLSSLNTILTREINSFDIKIDGFVKRDTIFYIQRPIISKMEEVASKIKSNLPQLQKILTSTGTPSNGSPFVVYHSQDSINNKFVYSIAIPVKSKIYTSEGSDIITGQINPSSTLKATVTGNYHHKITAVKQLYSYMKKNNLEVSSKFKNIEVLSKNILTDKSASKWVTEIYLPVKPIKKVIIYKPKKVNNDSLVNAIVKDILSADKTKKTN